MTLLTEMQTRIARETASTDFEYSNDWFVADSHRLSFYHMVKHLNGATIQNFPYLSTAMDGLKRCSNDERLVVKWRSKKRGTLTWGAGQKEGQGAVFNKGEMKT